MTTGHQRAGGEPIDRRRFLARGVRGAAGAGLMTLALGRLAGDARSHAPSALRPPGARDERDFLGACVRCGLCVRACPYPTLDLADRDDEIADGTPFFVARRAPCEMCEDIPCVTACPTGALDPALDDIDDSRMGLAVLIDEETCLNFLGLRCEVCYRVCPAIDSAISLEARPNPRTGQHAMLLPTVHSDACTGCGKCEYACVLEGAAIRVLPVALAKGRGGEHYRLGWEEKTVLPGLSDLPDRLPEATP